jgi:hypothetical protein
MNKYFHRKDAKNAKRTRKQTEIESLESASPQQEHHPVPDIERECRKANVNDPFLDVYYRSSLRSLRLCGEVQIP